MELEWNNLKLSYNIEFVNRKNYDFSIETVEESWDKLNNNILF